MALEGLDRAQVSNTEHYLQSIVGMTPKATGISNTLVNTLEVPNLLVAAIGEIRASLAALAVKLDALSAKVDALGASVGVVPHIHPVASGLIPATVTGPGEPVSD